MSVIVVTPPQPIVSWEEAKAHLKQDSDDEKDYVEALIAAATGWIDGPAGWLGRSLGPQLLELQYDCASPPIVHLPYGPVLEVDEYWVGETSMGLPFYLPGSQAVSLGVSTSHDQPLRIRYWAGYGKRTDDGEGWTSEAPAPIKQAILLLVGQWFRTRSAVNVGNIVNEMPFAVDALLSPYRRWS